MVSNRRVLFLYKLEINRIERIYRFKRETEWNHTIHEKRVELNAQIFGDVK